MQKALLMASVIIGAFLFQPSSNAQVIIDGKLGIQGSDLCPLGGNYAPALGMCFVASTLQPSCKITRLQTQNYANNMGITATSIDNLSFPGSSAVFPSCSTTGVNSSRFATDISYTHDFSFDCSEASPGSTSHSKQYNLIRTLTRKTTHRSSDGNCTYSTSETTDSVVRTMFITLTSSEVYQCPPESSNENFQVFNLGPYETEEGYNICFYLSSDPGNDDDDNCPPGTIGGCEPPEPECIIAGNGMEVCKADPNDKCQSTEQNGQTVYFNCEAGCGFVNDQFLCSGLPDSDGEIPDLSKCFKVGTSWACPSDPNPPDDNIQNPEKPLPDMNKGDFKEVQKGVETRLDATNSLLSEGNAIGKSIGEGVSDLNAKSLAANGILSAIRTNTGATAGNTKDILDLLKDNLGEGEPLELDNDWRSVFSSGLGVTGDETIDDLTKQEITLDQFKSEFQWGSSSSACPQPRPINILRNTFYMDWQPFCTAFNVLGYFILAAAYFLSIRIAFGGRT